MVRERLSLKLDLGSQVNISDFKSPQRISVNLCYLEVLANLGIKVVKVFNCITATKGTLFRPLAQKLFDLKSNSKTAFERNWLKLIGNR